MASFNPEPTSDPDERDSLKSDLRKYLDSMIPVTNGLIGEAGTHYHVISDLLPATDFSREIIPPGLNKSYQDGACGIRTDEAFWAVAALPPRFLRLGIHDLVAVIWPKEVPRATYRGDTQQTTRS